MRQQRRCHRMGLSHDEIDEVLSISSFAVTTHVNQAMVEPNAPGRARLVVFVYEAGLLQPD